MGDKTGNNTTTTTIIDTKSVNTGTNTKNKTTDTRNINTNTNSNTNINNTNNNLKNRTLLLVGEPEIIDVSSDVSSEIKVNKEIVVNVVINFDAILNMYGPVRGMKMYITMIEELNQLMDLEYSLNKNFKIFLDLYEAIEYCTSTRQAIIKRNENSVIHIPISRICIRFHNDMLVDVESQQDLSYHQIPIFIYGTVIDHYNFLDDTNDDIKLVAHTICSINGYSYYVTDIKKSTYKKRKRY